MRLSFILIGFFLHNLFSFSSSYAQVKVLGLEELPEKFYKVPEIKYGALNKDSKRIYFDLLSMGYIGCSIDSIVRVDTAKTAAVYFHHGMKYELSGIEIDSLTRNALVELGKINLYENKKKFSTQTYSRIVDYVLRYYEDTGHPFAEVCLEGADWNGVALSGTLSTTLNKRITFDQIEVKGDLEIDQKLINMITDIQAGDIYSQEKIDKVDTYLKGYPFIKIVKPTEYDFVNASCNVFMYLDKRNANFFNAILGVLPNDNGKVNITGDAKIKLVNVLNKGEQFLINWRKLLPLTQNLNLEANFPFVMRLPIGIGGKFDLYKKDTSFLDVISKLEVKYKFGQNLTFSGFFRNRTSNLLSTEKYQFVTQLPEFADIRNNEYGLAVQWQNLDFLYNPSKGWYTEIEASVGDKKINKNAALSEELYDGLNLRSTQFFLKGTVERYLQIYKKNIIKIGGTGGWVLNENLFMNELFRLGGLNTLRGFDEESIFASGFAIGTIEYRFLLEEFSNLFVFGQTMFYEQSIKDSYSQDIPYSFGAGINFQTKPGIFSVSYSLGSQQGNPVLFRAAKIHFGFVNYF